MGKRQVVLVLQGGGALGAYQAGVYEALHEADIEPDWVVGTSIGAINGALIVGNRREQRMERLRAFWRTVAYKGLPAPWLGQPAASAALLAVSQGLPGFFAPNPSAWLNAQWPLDEEAAGYYRTTALCDTLASLVDIERLNANAPRMTVGAVNVRTGAMCYFDSREEALDLSHVMASSALPPAFPPVRVGDELFWDGGIYSNTPVEAVLDDNPRCDSLIFAVQLWRPAGNAPQLSLSGANAVHSGAHHRGTVQPMARCSVDLSGSGQVSGVCARARAQRGHARARAHGPQFIHHLGPSASSADRDGSLVRRFSHRQPFSGTKRADHFATHFGPAAAGEHGRRWIVLSLAGGEPLTLRDRRHQLGARFGSRLAGFLRDAGACGGRRGGHRNEQDPNGCEYCFHKSFLLIRVRANAGPEGGALRTAFRGLVGITCKT